MSRLKRAALCLAALTILGAVSMLQGVFYVSARGDRPLWWKLFLINASYWYLWGALLPPILWLARRFPLDRQRLRLSLPVHLAATVLATVTWSVLFELARIGATLLSGRRLPLWPTIPLALLLHSNWCVLTYWAILGVRNAWHYYDESRREALVAADLAQQLAEVQLLVLRHQLQPHFLFNTLNAVMALLRSDVGAAERTLRQLTGLLRRILAGADQQEVALGDELELLQAYVAIERTRFRDRLTVSLDVPAELLGRRVPSLLLQPIVENAIRHGVAPRDEGGQVSLRAWLEGDLLWIEVRDDGPGLDPAAAAQPRGIGLANTRARLLGLYGDGHRFTLKNDGGLCVRLGVPAQRLAPAS